MKRLQTVLCLILVLFLVGMPTFPQTKVIDTRANEVRSIMKGLTSIHELESTATLFVDSKPAGASVYVDGRRVGETPCTVEIDTGVFRENEVMVAVSKDGYRTKRAKIKIVAGKQASWTPLLECIADKGSAQMMPQEYSKRPKWILEKTFQKYRYLSKDFKSVVAKAKLSLKDSEQLPDIDATIELLYAAKPRSLYLDISENQLNARVVVAQRQVTAVIILPGRKLFASISVPEKLIEKLTKKKPKKWMREYADKADTTNAIEELQKVVIMVYDGIQNTKKGKAHKIIIMPRDPSRKVSGAIYILDGKWDPARLEISSQESGKNGNLVIEFEKLKLNVDIPNKRFVPDTKEYVHDPNLMATMMLVINAMMQQNR